MSEWIRIKISDFYKNAVGEMEYTYVSPEVYEALINTFRKEVHAEHMRDLRNMVKEGYVEGETEGLLMKEEILLEDMVIYRLDQEKLQQAIQTLTEVQKERLHMYFFEGLNYAQIAQKLHISEHSVRMSVKASLNKLKNILNSTIGFVI